MSLHEELKKQAQLQARHDEAELIQDWKKTQNPKALASIFEKHKKLVAHIAYGYRGYGLPLEDLQSEGYIGIMHALRNFDLSKGFRFHTYAFWWIKAMMNDYILANSSLVKMVKNPHQKKLFFSLGRLKHKYNNQMSPEVITKIAEELKVPEAEVVYMNTRLQKDTSLNATIKSDEESEWIDWIADERHLPDFEALQEDELKRRKHAVDEAMHALNKREYDILMKRKMHEPPVGLEELARDYDISKERVRQIENAALEKLKKAVHYGLKN
jgi:RNA polymerase sigma-32 factor